MSDDEFMRFDIYTVKYRADKSAYVTPMFMGLSLPAAEILSGTEVESFGDGIIQKGWVGTSPAWLGFQPVVVMPHGELIRNDQFKFLIELAG